MGDASNICADGGAPLDFSSAMPLEAMIELLETAVPFGPEVYLPAWRRAAGSVGITVTLMWDDVWPYLLSGVTDGGDARGMLAERFRWRDVLFDHLSAHGFRSDLIRSLIGADEGTNPRAEDYDVGRATAIVVADYLGAGGRIQIEADGALSSGSGIHDQYGLGDEARDLEIERAASAYLIATLCPRAAAGIRLIVAQIGKREANGWIDLRNREVALEEAFAAWKAALIAIRSSDIDADDATEWALFVFAETIICASTETGQRAAEIQLWMALREILLTHEHNTAILGESLEDLRGCPPPLDPSAGYVIRAVAALRGGQS